jgi:hypothetical protein
VNLERGNLQLRTDLENATVESRSSQARLEGEQQKTAKAQKEAADAQLELRKYVEHIEYATNPRWRNVIGREKDITDALRGKPVSKFEILYVSEDEEAFTLASVLHGILLSAGWTASDFRPLKESDALGGTLNIPSVPLAVRSGAWWGMSINVKKASDSTLEHVNDSAAAALVMALGGGQIGTDPRLPDDIVRLVIGKKP